MLAQRSAIAALSSLNEAHAREQSKKKLFAAARFFRIIAYAPAVIFHIGLCNANARYRI